MWDLGALSERDMSDLVGRMRALEVPASSIEESADALVSYFRRELVDPTSGTSAVVLARCFVTTAWADLPGSVREAAGPVAADPADDTPVLALLATDGELPEWQDRHRSAAHQAVPLRRDDLEARAPMISALLRGLGVELDELADAVRRARSGDLHGLATSSFGVFHEPVAAGSAQVPDQEFVHAHGIASVLGFGGMLPDGTVFALLLFTRVPVPALTAQLFGTAALSAKLVLLSSGASRLFADGPERPVPAQHVQQLRETTLRQLLDVQTMAAAHHAAGLQAVMRALEARDSRLRQEASVIETLHSIGSALAAELDLERLVQKVTDAAVSLSGAEFGAFFYNVVNERDEAYLLYTLSGAPRSAFERFPMPRNTAIFEPTFRGDGPVRSDDITRDHRYGRSGPHYGMPEGHLPVRSYLAVPVVSLSGGVLGGLFLGHPEPAVFDARSERLVVGLAAQASVAMDNARLYRQQRETAVELQRSLLPDQLPDIEGLDLAFRYLPGAQGAQVGGDWVDVIRLSGGRVAFVIGDVMGRGLQAAAVMGQLRTAVRAYSVIGLPPEQVLANLDTLVGEMPGNHIATCLYAVYDPAHERLTVSSAGHPPLLLALPDGTSQFVGEEPGTPLGVPFRVPHALELTVPAGASLIFYTDGLVERRDSSLSDGMARLHRALPQRLGGEALDVVCDKLLDACLDLQATPDDVALLVARVTPGVVPLRAYLGLAGHDDAAREAREFTARTLGEWELCHHQDDVLMVVSELVANAVRHADGAVGIDLLRSGDRLAVEVADASPGVPKLDNASVEEEHGRGLMMVDRLTDRWGSRPTDDGKVVWAELAVLSRSVLADASGTAAGPR